MAKALMKDNILLSQFVTLVSPDRQFFRERPGVAFSSSGAVHRLP